MVLANNIVIKKKMVSLISLGTIYYVELSVTHIALNL